MENSTAFIEDAVGQELNVAAEWWANKLKVPQPQDNGDGLQSALTTIVSHKNFTRIPDDLVGLFKIKLRDELLKGHARVSFKPDAPRSTFGGFGTDYGPDGCLWRAGEQAGVKIHSTTFPIKTIMWIKPGKVTVSQGYRAEVKTIYTGLVIPKSLDLEFELAKITAVKECSDGWEISREDVGCFYIDSKYGVQPKVGATAKFYGRGFGHVVRGVDIDDKEVYYRTPKEQEALHKQQCAAHNVEQKETFEKNKAELDADYDALPPVFKARIDKFRQNNADFRWKYEGYEMFCCKEAVKIATAFNTPEAIKEFKEHGWEKQKAVLPGLGDGHSGNTFGAACYLAQLYIVRPNDVVKVHGALAPLVGSEEYGCVPKDNVPVCVG